MEKDAIRQRVWDELEERGEARFPFPPHGRIPNFASADAAADRLTETEVWSDATVVKANPDAPQLPVRRQALHEGKTVYMAVPRLREAECFVELDPARLDDPDAAATVSEMDQHGEAVAPEAVPPIDLVIAGSVAVTTAGARIGKGEGYSDLEYAVLAAFNRVRPDTTIATTVHECQVIVEAPAPDPHDVPLDLIVTPDRLVRTESPFERPSEIDWARLDPERIAEIPVLEELRETG
ncbi:MAG: 5-formyltetrahydrofolate cyclo-ligase [Halobacteriales archaeon]